MPETKAVAATKALLATSPFNTLLGMEFHAAHRDGVTLRCPMSKILRNTGGVMHGGVFASVADAAVGVAIHHKFRGTRKISTVEMKINYFRPVADGVLYARAILLRVGSTLSIGRVDLTDSEKNLVGVAIVTYIFLDARGK